jgi:hypothetical protein
MPSVSSAVVLSDVVSSVVQLDSTCFLLSLLAKWNNASRKIWIKKLGRCMLLRYPR